MPELPADLVRAFSDGGRPTIEQVRRLAQLEAEFLGLTLQAAVEAAQEDRLPHTPVGIDLRYWVRSLGLS